jgi:hypothetical protein
MNIILPGVAQDVWGGTKLETNPNYPNSKQDLFGHLKLEFGAYLEFGICDLGF